MVTTAQTGTVVAHTDGACLGNPGPGGWAAILEWNGQVRELSGGYRLTTNNRMEVLAVIEALDALRRTCTVEVWSDSQYLCHAVNKGWLTSWQKKGWKTSDKKPVKNRDLWERLLPLLRRHTVTFHWLRGHSGHPLNERCDVLAKEAARQTGLPEDAGYAASD